MLTFLKKSAVCLQFGGNGLCRTWSTCLLLDSKTNDLGGLVKPNNPNISSSSNIDFQYQGDLQGFQKDYVFFNGDACDNEAPFFRGVHKSRQICMPTFSQMYRSRSFMQKQDVHVLEFIPCLQWQNRLYAP